MQGPKLDAAAALSMVERQAVQEIKALVSINSDTLGASLD